MAMLFGASTRLCSPASGLGPSFVGESGRWLGGGEASRWPRPARIGTHSPALLPATPARVVPRAAYGGAGPFDPVSPFESLSRMQEQMEQMDRLIDAEMRGVQERVQQVREEAARQSAAAEKLASEGRITGQVDGAGLRGYRWESSGSVQGGGASVRSYQSVIIVQGQPPMGMYGPPPAAHFGLQSAVLGLVLLASTAYAALAAAFSKGYHATKYKESPRQRLQLALLWPVLYALSGSFRDEFREALKGGSPQPPGGAKRDGGEPGSSASV
mmetsp:Transcript_17885/g.46599  ORF Transcript_17885/g.46599 Transcript_17885/m.46599 type:complete len:271 (-) Transcript_17885:247-1059(-)